MDRRSFLAVAALGPASGFVHCLAAAEAVPTDDPLAGRKLAWTAQLPWGKVADVSTMPGVTFDERMAAAQERLKPHGGVIFIPAGVHRVQKSIVLQSGIILRGANPAAGVSARDEAYALGTRLEFPKYLPLFTGDGTPISSAFFGIHAEAEAAGIGVVNIAVNHGHVHFRDAGASGNFAAGERRFVVGCIVRNAAVADATMPKLDLGRKPWQRFTARHHAAIDVRAGRHLLIAGNRLPRSGDDNFTMDGFTLLNAKKQRASIDGVVFDYDNRPGIYANHYALGGAGGAGPDGTPESHPHGFREGTVIRDNFLEQTGRTAIGFSGLGVRCLNNVIRMPDDVWRPTATGLAVTTGSSTNDNRAIEMRGWDWIVDGNDYVVHRNWAYDRKYKINDGEGLMHEDHVNSTVRDSVLTNNRGNAYLSIYKTAGIDGLLVEGNDIRLGDGKRILPGASAIFVSADRTKDRFPIRKVSIVRNTVSGGGILISGDPAADNVVRGNKNAADGQAALILQADGTIADGNDGFRIVHGS